MSKYFAEKVWNLNSSAIIFGGPDEQKKETFPYYFHDIFQLTLSSTLLSMYYTGMSGLVEDPMQQ